VRVVHLRDSVHAAMVHHAESAAPFECCGLLLGTSDTIIEAVPVPNAANDPRRRYLIDPRDHFAVVRQARRRRLEVLGAYHSHPRSAAQPSFTDAAEAFADFVWVIVGLAGTPEVTAWAWAEGNFNPVRLVRLPEGWG
jgi:desampylase